MTLKEFHALIDAHIVHAKEKHPIFAHKLMRSPMEYYDSLANGAKLAIKTCVQNEDCPASVVIIAELYEFFTELAAGNLDRAKEEAADTVATIYRALEMLEEQKESNHE